MAFYTNASEFQDKLLFLRTLKSALFSTSAYHWGYFEIGVILKWKFFKRGTRIGVSQR